MDVEHDCDDSHFFILPSDFFRHLRQELAENIENCEVAARILYGLGRSAAIDILKSSKAGDLEDEPLEHVMHMHWAEIGLGMMSIWSGENESYIIRNKRGTEACAIGFTGEVCCHFSRGYLAGLVFALTGRKYIVEEKECICQGLDHCTLVLSKP